MLRHRRGGATVPSPGEVRSRELPQSVERLVDRYEAIFDSRDRYMWGWLDAVLPEFRLDSVPERYRTLADEGRLLVCVYVTALNDLSDRRADDTAFEAAARIPLEGPPEPGSPIDEPGVQLAASAWMTLRERLDDAPNADRYLPRLRENLAATARAQRHSAHIAAHPGDADYEECLTAQSPTMGMDALATVDLICSPGFDPTDEPELRAAIRAIEPLGRIGNWLTTWERELAEGDLANGVVVRAVEENVVSPSDVVRARLDPRVRSAFADRIREANVERLIARDRERRYRYASNRGWEADSVDLDAYVEAMTTVWDFHKASYGYK